MRKVLDRTSAIICRCSSIIIGALIGALIIINFIQLVTRYFISVTFLWAEEISIMFIIYACAFGAPWVTLKRSHLKMDAAEKYLSRRVKLIAHWGMHVLTLAFSIILIVAGIKTTKANAGYRSSILRFDEFYRYLPILIEGILLLIGESIITLEDILDIKEGKEVLK